MDETVFWRDGFRAGASRLQCRMDLLNAINVFPVADGDTGVNLSATVAPLECKGRDRSWVELRRELLLAARGNSGNLLSRFLSGLIEGLASGEAELAQAARRGRDQAYGAVPRPVQGTILTVMDVLCSRPEAGAVQGDPDVVQPLVEALREAVRDTPRELPMLEAAGVVDAGALGLLFFLEGFLYGMHGLEVPDGDREWDGLSVRADWLSGHWAEDEGQFCVDLALRRGNGPIDPEQVERLGRSVELVEEDGLFKIHLHTDKLEPVREWADALGEVVAWNYEDMDRQRVEFRRRHGLEEFVRPERVRTSGAPRRWKAAGTRVHVLTDGAGSISRNAAEELGVSLNFSHVFLGGRMVPECDVEPDELYSRLAEDREPITTAQASEEEIRARLTAACAAHEAVLYVAVGRQYTGNIEVARRWKQECDVDDRLRILDSRAASGQLSLVARTVAEFAAGCDDPGVLLDYAEERRNLCKEYVFLDTLKYLARSGRMSRVGAFFGNAFKVKPVIVHQDDGAKKETIVRSREAGLAYARERAREYFTASIEGRPRILLQYTDAGCQEWVEGPVTRMLQEAVPDAELLYTPMSTTAGTHMGPGAWAVAFIRA